MLEPSFGDEETRPPLPRGRQPQPIAPDEDAEPKRRSLRPQRSYQQESIKGAAVIAAVALVGGVLLSQWPNAVALYQKFRTPQTADVRDAPAPSSRSTRSPTGSNPACSLVERGSDCAGRRAGRRGRAEGRALRGGSGRSERQALRRLGDLAHRDGVARSRSAARTCDPRRRRNPRAQARDDLVAPPQHRQEPAGEPHGRDHVQAAGRTSPRAASPTCPAS